MVLCGGIHNGGRIEKTHRRGKGYETPVAFRPDARDQQDRQGRA